MCNSHPSLRNYEASLLHVLEKLSNGYMVEINGTDTKLYYKPYIFIGNHDDVHDYNIARPIGYFLKMMLHLRLFEKKLLTIPPS